MEARCFSGARLREARTAAGYRPEQLALRIGRSVYSIHEYERGRVCPPTEVIARLADTLDVDADELHETTTHAPRGIAESDDFDRHVRAVVDNFPRLNTAQRSQIATLLRTAHDGGDAA